MPKDKFEFDPNEPDTIDGDFYCKICYVCMNSSNMWASHITGRKHIKKLLKGPKVIYKRKVFDDNEEEHDYDMPSEIERLDDRSDCFESPDELSYNEHEDRYYDTQWFKRNIDSKNSPYISDKEHFYPNESERCFSGSYMPDRPDVYLNTGRLFEDTASFGRFDEGVSLVKSGDRCDFLTPIVKDYGHKSIELHTNEGESMDKPRHNFFPEETEETDHCIIDNETVLDTTTVANIIDEMFKERFSSNISAEKNEPFYPEMNLDPIFIKKTLDEHFKPNSERNDFAVNEQGFQIRNNTTDTLQKVISNLFNQKNVKENDCVNSFVKQIQQRISSVAATDQKVSNNKNELQKVISDIIGVKVNKDLDKIVVHGENSNDVIAHEITDTNSVSYDVNKNFQSFKDDRVISQIDYNSRDHRRVEKRSADQKMMKESMSKRDKVNKVSQKRDDSRERKRDDSREHEISKKDLYNQSRQDDEWAAKVDDFIHKKLDKYSRYDNFSEKSKRRSRSFRRRHSSSSSSSSSSKSNNGSKQRKKYCKLSYKSNLETSLIKFNERNTPEPLIKYSSSANQKSFKESVMTDNDLSKIYINEFQKKKLNKGKFDEINPDNLEPEDIDSLLSSYLKPKELADDAKTVQENFKALSTKSFLQIVLTKLDNIDINGMEELNVLTQIIAKAQILLYRKLPPRVLAALNQKMSQSGSKNVLSSLCSGQSFLSKSLAQTIPGYSMDKMPTCAENQLNSINEYLSSSKSNYRPVSFTSTATLKNNSPSLSEIKQSVSHQSHPSSSLSSKIRYSLVTPQVKSSSTASRTDQFIHQTKPSSDISSSTKYSTAIHNSVTKSTHVSRRHYPVKQEKSSLKTGITSSFGKQAKSNSLSFSIKHSGVKPLNHNPSKECNFFFTR